MMSAAKNILVPFPGAKTFFAPLSNSDREKQYWAIWNQIYNLKEYCGLSLLEQRLMTAEERIWYIERHNEELEKRRDRERKANSRSSISKPNVRYR